MAGAITPVLNIFDGPWIGAPPLLKESKEVCLAKPIQDGWVSFAEKFMAPNCPPRQHMDMRYAFFHGAMHAYHILGKAGSQEALEKIMQDMTNEYTAESEGKKII
jgi:hypothetical protein